MKRCHDFSSRLILAWTLLSSLYVCSGEPVVAADKPAVVNVSARERLSAEVHRILKEAKSSDYSHKTQVNEDEGSYDVDCSGLVNIILKKIAKEHYTAVQKAGGRPRPRAVEYHTTFISEDAPKGWRCVKQLADAKPGDLLVWRRKELTPGEDTGHIVILDEAPKKDDDGQFHFAVIDSTKSGHGDDTRKKDDTGIGRGTIWVAVDGEGKPTGFRWKSRKGELHAAMMAIGRVEDLH